jgi:hypothetical protein
MRPLELDEQGRSLLDPNVYLHSELGLVYPERRTE